MQTADHEQLHGRKNFTPRHQSQPITTLRTTLSAHVAVLGLSLGGMVVVGRPVSALVVEQRPVFLAALSLDYVQVAPRGIVVPWSRQIAQRY